MPLFTLLASSSVEFKTKFLFPVSLRILLNFNKKYSNLCVFYFLELNIAASQENLSKSFCFFLKTLKLKTSKKRIELCSNLSK